MILDLNVNKQNVACEVIDSKQGMLEKWAKISFWFWGGAKYMKITNFTQVKLSNQLAVSQKYGTACGLTMLGVSNVWQYKRLTI